jgi:hypothetical protein
MFLINQAKKLYFSDNDLRIQLKNKMSAAGDIRIKQVERINKNHIYRENESKLQQKCCAL